MKKIDDPNLSVQQIATDMGLSTRYVYNLFAHEKHSPADYIREKRLEKSRQYLSDKNKQYMSITDIAYACGFNSSAYFSSLFSMRYSRSPRSHRCHSKTNRLLSRTFLKFSPINPERFSPAFRLKWNYIISRSGPQRHTCCLQRSPDSTCDHYKIACFKIAMRSCCGVLCRVAALRRPAAPGFLRDNR